MEIDVKELKSRLESGGLVNLIDVREEWEYEEVNIGARNIPLGSLPEKLEELAELKDQEIIVHCKSGGRSTQAQKFLRAKGFTKIRNLVGGIEAYLAE